MTSCLLTVHCANESILTVGQYSLQLHKNLIVLIQLLKLIGLACMRPFQRRVGMHLWCLGDDWAYAEMTSVLRQQQLVDRCT